MYDILNLSFNQSDFANLTGNISDSTLIAAASITVPALSKVPGLGKQARSVIGTALDVVIAVYLIGLIGNGLSIIHSITAFVAHQLIPRSAPRSILPAQV